MSAPHGCTDDTAVVDRFKEALKDRIGADRYRLWFDQGVQVQLQWINAGDAGEERETDQQVAAQTSGDSLASPSSPQQSPTAAKTPNGSVNQMLPPGAKGRFIIRVRSQFAADRMVKHFMQEIRGAAMHASELTLGVHVEVLSAPIQQSLVQEDGSQEQTQEGQSNGAASPSNEIDPSLMVASPQRPRSSARGARHASTPGAAKRKRGNAKPLASLFDLAESDRGEAERQKQAPLGSSERSQSHSQSTSDGQPRKVASPATAGRSESDLPTQSVRNESSRLDGGVKGLTTDGSPPAVGFTIDQFICAGSNQLAYTAAQMACHSPGSATPLFFHGPTGVGKTHLIHAIADQLRRRHRLRRVVHLSAEHFTNDFIKSVGTSGLSSFRRRYRDVDALLIDDVQFVAAKKATLRELLYTVETLISAGRPLVFSANRSPSEINGLNSELVGRLAAGLVCPMEPLCGPIRVELMSRLVKQRCEVEWDEDLIGEISNMIDGDGRLISGVVNLISTLQRMYRRMPTMDEIRQFGGQMLRSQAPPVTLRSIVRAVANVFDLEESQLLGNVQTRRVSEPRMLAMYLSRQMTSSAFSEIAQHYGGRSHSTAIAATKKVEGWIDDGKSIGRGSQALSATQAVQRIQHVLRTG